MNIAYIGKGDDLAAKVIERLGKEDNSVFLLAGEDFKREQKPITKYKYFRVFDWKQGVYQHLKTIYPDVVIYADPAYMDYEWEEEHKESVAMLSSVLDDIVKLEIKKFIFLSSTEVYGKYIGEIDEETEINPISKKGIRMAQCEYAISLYRKRYDLDVKILRVAPVFTYRCVTDSKELLGVLFQKSSEMKENRWLQPVHVADVADAIKRTMELSSSQIYNVAASDVISEQKISRLLCKKDEYGAELVAAENVAVRISSRKLKKETEWIDFWQIEKMLKEDKVKFVHQKKTQETEKKKNIRQNLSVFRKLAEVLVLFGVFMLIYLLTLDHNLFGKINWLLIFVTVVPLFYGVRYGTLAVALASLTFLGSQGGGLMEIDSFYSYVDKILVIVEYILFGIVVGYTVDMLRESNAEKDLEIEDRKLSYDELNEINEKNILIKKEYEKRILESKDSLPRLYQIISRINVLEEGRIFMEILQVVQDLLGTNTVAIYRSNEKSPYLRLLACLNENSLMGGRSWNIEKETEIKNAIEKNEIYEGDIWTGKPAIVMPVGTTGGYSAIIVVRTLPMEKMNLHSLNLMRTMFALISTSIEKALQYDNVAREKKYIGDTLILRPEEFQKKINISVEKKQKNMSEYCILKVVSDENLLDTYHAVEKSFREVDIFGTDGKENLYILLDNTTPKDEAFVLERLAKKGIMVEKKEEDIL